LAAIEPVDTRVIIPVTMAADMTTAAVRRHRTGAPARFNMVDLLAAPARTMRPAPRVQRRLPGS